MNYKIPLLLAPQPEGGYTVTSPLLPELVTEGDSVEEALANVRDALAAVIELYEERGRPLPENVQLQDFENVAPAAKIMDLGHEDAACGFGRIRDAIESSRTILGLNDNWDDGGAVGYSQEVWERATQLLQKLATLAFHSLGVMIDPPRILPGPDGSIDVLWKTDRYELLVNFPADPAEPASYYGDNKLGNMPIKNTFDPSKPDRKLVAWLCLFE